MSTITEKQVSFIQKLVVDRLDPDDPQDAAWKDQVLESLNEGRVDRAHASTVIDYLLGRKPMSKKVEVVDARTVPNGTYTLVFDGDRRTLRLRSADWAKDLPPGSQVAEFLSGPDNEADFTGFAFIVKNQPRVWKRFREDQLIVTALHALLQLDDENVKEAGYRYALESSRCYRCNRTLTVPASIHRGLGPVCAGVMEGEEG
jgi:hypothetical protein